MYLLSSFFLSHDVFVGSLQNLSLQCNKVSEEFWMFPADGFRTYLHWAWKNLMRFCRKSTPFLVLISLTLRRYCRERRSRHWLTVQTQAGVDFLLDFPEFTWRRLTSHICSWNSRRSFSISSAISPPLNSVRIIPCCLACSRFSFSIFALQRSEVESSAQFKKFTWANVSRIFNTAANSTRCERSHLSAALVSFIIINTITKLYYKVVYNSSCWRLCRSQDDDHDHLFWARPKINIFWHKVYLELVTIFGTGVTFNWDELLFGLVHSANVINI